MIMTRKILEGTDFCYPGDNSDPIRNQSCLKNIRKFVLYFLAHISFSVSVSKALFHKHILLKFPSYNVNFII